MKQEIIICENQKQVAELLMRGGKWRPGVSDDGYYCEFDTVNYPCFPFRFVAPDKSNYGMSSEWTCKQWTKYIEPIEDKWPSMFWDDDEKIRRYGFYDKINDCSFDSLGYRDGFKYDNIIPLKKEEVPAWMWEVRKELED